MLFPFAANPHFDVDGDYSENEALVTHSAGVVGAVETAISLLDKPNELHDLLHALGKRHAAYLNFPFRGVIDAHFDLVGGAFLKTLQMGLGESYTDDINAAFTAMWVAVSDTMKAGIDAAQSEE